MSEQDNGEEAVLEAPEEVVLETTDESEEESIEEVKAKLAKAEELANNYKIRAEKAEKAKVAPAPNKPAVQATAYTLEDQIAILKADVPVEDISVVQEYANFKKIPLAEAVKSPIVKAELAERKELRTSAQAANVGSSKRGSGKVTDDMLIANAGKGQLPESEDDMIRLWRAKKGLK